MWPTYNLCQYCCGQAAHRRRDLTRGETAASPGHLLSSIYSLADSGLRNVEPGAGISDTGSGLVPSVSTSRTEGSGIIVHHNIVVTSTGLGVRQTL